MSPKVSTFLLLPLGVAALACSNSDGGSGNHEDANPRADDAETSRPAASENFLRDIVSYDLNIDLTAKTAVATIELAGSSDTGLSLDIGNLVINKVSDSVGDLMSIDLGSQLNIGVPAGGETRTVAIDYVFGAHEEFDGWMEERQLSFLWPTFCGNLYPCNSNPAEGARFTMSVSGVGAGLTAIYPTNIPADAPAYMPAIAVGDFTELPLGTTTAGTELSVWYQPGQETAATAGTVNLRDVFEFLETTYGPYSFGAKAGTVSADWGGGDFGGMEHHPYWHVSSGSLASEEVNAHEAAHGWFGNGVRIACWEDFVLSEGVVTYMAARALAESGVDLWPDYDCSLRSICRGGGNTTSLLSSCGEIDLLSHPLWSGVPYQKGAQYLREVSGLLGEDVLDDALSEFYLGNVGKAARMRDLVELLKSKGESEAIEALTVSWLETEACPASAATLCAP